MSLSHLNDEQQRIKKILEEAYLNIRVDEETLNNPLIVPELFRETPHEWLAHIMSQPEYFYLICKEILNIELMPYQGILIKEMWTHRFPMVIASRGASKTFTMALYSLLRMILIPKRQIVCCGAAFRQAKAIFNYMEKIWSGAPILRDIAFKYAEKGGEVGPNKSPEMYKFNIGSSTSLFIPVGPGGDKIRGLRSQDLIVDEFNCLSPKTLCHTSQGLMSIEDYLKGKPLPLLNKDGNWEVPQKICRTEPVDVYKVNTRHGYTFECSIKHRVMTPHGWVYVKDLKKDDVLILDTSPNPTTPYKVNKRDFDEESAFISAIASLYAHSTNAKTVVLKDCPELFPLLKKYDGELYESGYIILRNEKLRSMLYQAGVQLSPKKEKVVPKAILRSPNHVILSFIRGLFTSKLGYFYNGFHIKCPNLEYAQCVQLLLLKLKMLSHISNTTVSVIDGYAHLFKKLLGLTKFVDNPTTEGRTRPIPILNENAVYMYVGENIYLGSVQHEYDIQTLADKYLENKEFTRVTSVEKLDKQEVLYDFYVPSTHSFIGNGFIQHNSIPKDIFETVMAAFNAVSANPVESSKIAALIKLANTMGIDPADYGIDIDSRKAVPNQLIISGTAGYTFEHFYQYWRDWKQIICSRGDRKKLEEYIYRKQLDSELDPEEILSRLDWRDYSIFRLPYNMIPEGFMDAAQVTRSKATMHSGTYQSEYGACGTNPKELIMTDMGYVPYDELQIGDKVLTHKGNWKKVIKKTHRYYDGKIIKAKTSGSNNILSYTIDHPFFKDGACEPIHSTDDRLLYPKLQDISNLEEVDGIKLDYSCGVLCGIECSTHNKHCNPKILYSNKDFMYGFLNGVLENTDILKTKSKMLLGQIRTILSYFNISSTVDIDTISILTVNTYTDKVYVEDIHTEDYSGLVYNLEVEDDHSYVLSNCATHNCFSDDSNGFFKASLIKSATVGPNKEISNEDEKLILFEASLYGMKNRQYIFGIDPASESDNMAITVLELYPNHRRVVYCWTTNKEQHRYEIKNGITEEHDYFAYCILKIRELMKRFPCVRIMLDAGGGGVSIREGLANKRLLGDGEQSIYEYINTDKPKDTDTFEGLHILEMCQFRQTDWVAEANNGLKFDLERRKLLFPYFDPIVLAVAEGDNLNTVKEFDTLEYCMTEIEELKKEITNIVVSLSPTGLQRWDTPETKIGNKKGKMRKDRYSALLIANMGARQMENIITPYTNTAKESTRMFVGNELHTSALESCYREIYGF